MKRVRNDLLRNERGTMQVHYHRVEESGLSIEMVSRTLRATPEQFRRMEALITEMFEGTPELQAVPK